MNWLQWTLNPNTNISLKNRRCCLQNGSHFVQVSVYWIARFPIAIEHLMGYTLKSRNRSFVLSTAADILFLSGLLIFQCMRIFPRDAYQNNIYHDDVIKWKHFPRYWPFVQGIHWSSVNSPHKGQWRGALVSSLICAWISGWAKQSWGWWFETPSHQLWRHCNV